ncbi:hypothetical protein D9611_002094 [Ephemerocybe angulata]|uniref:Uncharacterized protein n=1 Tax=Ephemerocybe angulata TaxID=980116 RepID=A0A8H5FMJ1_9AGAR|nr:hypothetical protein D9611_002094 [Tulosesus angulatus]
MAASGPALIMTMTSVYRFRRYILARSHLDLSALFFSLYAELSPMLQPPIPIRRRESGVSSKDLAHDRQSYPFHRETSRKSKVLELGALTGSRFDVLPGGSAAVAAAEKRSGQWQVSGVKLLVHPVDSA